MKAKVKMEKDMQKDTVYFGKRISAGQKRLVGVVLNLSGKADARAVASLRERAGSLSGYNQLISIGDENGEAVFVFEVYSSKDTSLVKRIAYRVRKVLTAAMRYAGITNSFVWVSLDGGDVCSLPVHGAD